MQNQNQNYVSVIIPTFKDWERLDLCLNSLEGQTLSKDSFEVLVINNDPHDVRQLTGRPKNFQILTESSAGSYAARNLGIRHAKGNLFAFTDSDCIPEPDWLEQGCIFFQQNNNVDRMSGAITVFDLDTNSDYVNTYEKLFAFKQDRYAKTGLAATANLFARRRAFELVGVFDDSSFSGGDHEWNNRAQEAGLELKYNPDCIVLHPARNVKQILKKTKRLYPNYLKNNFKYKSKVLLFFFGPYLLRPSAEMAKLLMEKWKLKEISANDALNIYRLMYRMRVIQFIEHYKLMLGTERERQ